MAQVFLDNFAGSGEITAHASDSGHSWAYSTKMFFSGFSPHTGNLTLAGGQVSIAGSAYAAAYADDLVVPSADYSVKVRITGDYANPQEFGFAGRYDEASGAGYFVPVIPSDVGEVKVRLAYNTDGPDGGTLHSNSFIAVADSSDFTVTLKMDGSEISVYIDDVLAFAVTDSHVTAAGSVGFWVQPDSSFDMAMSSMEANTLRDTFWTRFDKTAEILA